MLFAFLCLHVFVGVSTMLLVGLPFPIWYMCLYVPRWFGEYGLCDSDVYLSICSWVHLMGPGVARHHRLV
jgi:hypothetical protein